MNDPILSAIVRANIAPVISLRSEVDTTIDNIKRMVGWLNDPEVVRYSEQRHKKHDLHSQLAYIESFRHGEFNEILLNGEPIGTITGRVDDNNKIADMGILIGERPVWGCGYGTVAWRLMMKHLFRDFKVRKIEAGCMECNRGMMAVFRKTGMSCEGYRIGHFLFNDGDGEKEHCLAYWMKWRE